MRQIKFEDFMTELFNNCVYDQPLSFEYAYLKDGDGDFHLINNADLMDSRFRCDDNYWDEYTWIQNDDTRIYVE